MNRLIQCAAACAVLCPTLAAAANPDAITDPHPTAPTLGVFTSLGYLGSPGGNGSAFDVGLRLACDPVRQVGVTEVDEQVVVLVLMFQRGGMRADFDFVDLDVFVLEDEVVVRLPRDGQPWKDLTPRQHGRERPTGECESDGDRRPQGSFRHGGPPRNYGRQPSAPRRAERARCSCDGATQ